MNKKKFMSVDELAERWGFTYVAIRTMIKEGKIPAVRLNGHRWRVDIEDVEAYEARAKAAAESEAPND